MELVFCPLDKMKFFDKLEAENHDFYNNIFTQILFHDRGLPNSTGLGVCVYKHLPKMGKWYIQGNPTYGYT